MPRKLVVYGLSHHTTPVDVRERLASDQTRAEGELRELVEIGPIHEGVLLSTCNRVELIATTDEPHRAREQVLSLWGRRAAPEKLEGHLYEHSGLDAVRHLFRVASGLDSMVIGEPQILGQVKEAFGVAQRAGAASGPLARCFERAFSVAKRVRNDTDIAAGNVSVSSIACELAERIFGELSQRRVLLIGAGKMSETAARSLKARGASLTVLNRSPERARELAQACGGEARPLEALATELAAADVVISSTAKEGFVLSYELMQGVVKMRKWRQLFVIDIAVPRDVDPRVESLRNVFLYNMDDLKRVSHENLSARERAAADAEVIIEEEVQSYDRWLRTQELTPTIVALRERVREVVQREKQKTLPRLSSLSSQEARALDAMCEAIVSQLLHAPLTELKRSSEERDGAALLEAAQKLFRLSVEPQGTSAQEPEDASLSPVDPQGRPRG